jgi:hypothetical protein
MTEQELRTVLRAIGRFVGDRIAPLRQRIDELEKRQAQCQLKYMGVWSHDQYYQEGNFVTHAGSLWCCLKAQTMERPGSCADWQLAVKRGHDARADARYAKQIARDAPAKVPNQGEAA